MAHLSVFVPWIKNSLFSQLLVILAVEKVRSAAKYVLRRIMRGNVLDDLVNHSLVVRSDPVSLSGIA